MKAHKGQPPKLNGCDVLPPLDSPPPNRRQADDRPQAAMQSKSSRQKTGERFAVLNGFIDHTAGTLPRSELLVWLVLYRDTKNGVARTAQADIKRRTGLGKRTVGMAIKRLAERGLLEVVRRGGLGRGPSSYRVWPLPRAQPVAP